MLSGKSYVRSNCFEVHISTKARLQEILSSHDSEIEIWGFFAVAEEVHFFATAEVSEEAHVVVVYFGENKKSTGGVKVFRRRGNFYFGRRSKGKKMV